MTDSKRQELEDLKAQVHQLETEVRHEEAGQLWQPSGFYGTYYATTGAVLGGFASLVSLLINIIGAPLAGKEPLALIRIYLTFPLGETALGLADQATKTNVINDNMIIAFGCTLYLGTGMLLGIPIYLILTKFVPKATLVKRLVVAGTVALVIWVINFYGILSWLQPMVCKGNWITNQEFLPWWVAAGTHLLFGWTMALLYPLGQFAIYKRPTTEASEI